MGYYIQTPENLRKANQLVVLYGAEIVPEPIKKDELGGNGLICVVENGLFDAAAVCYSDQEASEFNDPADPRPKTWLTLPKDKIIELCPDVESKL